MVKGVWLVFSGNPAPRPKFPTYPPKHNQTTPTATQRALRRGLRCEAVFRRVRRFIFCSFFECGSFDGQDVPYDKGCSRFHCASSCLLLVLKKQQTNTTCHFLECATRGLASVSGNHDEGKTERRQKLRSRERAGRGSAAVRPRR